MPTPQQTLEDRILNRLLKEAELSCWNLTAEHEALARKAKEEAQAIFDTRRKEPHVPRP